MSLILVLLMAEVVHGQVDKEALRKAAGLPYVSVQMNIGLHPIHGWVIEFDKRPPAEEIKAIAAQMKGDAGDAERYYLLGQLYSDEKQWKDAYAKAADLFRQRLARTPEDGYLLARLGLTVCALDQIKEAETLLRQAVAKSPQDWRCWSALGQIKDGQWQDLLPRKKGYFGIVKSINSSEPFPVDYLARAPRRKSSAKSRRSAPKRRRVSKCRDRWARRRTGVSRSIPVELRLELLQPFD